MKHMVLETDRMALLERKLDFIIDELAHLRRQRESASDLAGRLAQVVKDLPRSPGQELSDANGNAAEVAALLGAVLANASLLREAVLQLRSAADFVADAQPVMRDAFQRLIELTQAAQQRGYFDALRAGARVADALLRSHSSGDWEQLESSVPQLVGLLRELTRPEVLRALEEIVHGFGRVQATMNVNKSVPALARDLASSPARRGIAILVEFLKVVGAHAAPDPAINPSPSITPR